MKKNGKVIDFTATKGSSRVHCPWIAPQETSHPCIKTDTPFIYCVGITIAYFSTVFIAKLASPPTGAEGESWQLGGWINRSVIIIWRWKNGQLIDFYSTKGSSGVLCPSIASQEKYLPCIKTDTPFIYCLGITIASFSSNDKNANRQAITSPINIFIILCLPFTSSIF